MSCKQNKAVMEAVARGGELPDALHGHLADCPDCRVLFAEELALFAATDSRVHRTVNAEPSASFFLSIRARIADELPVGGRWSPAWAVAATLALFVLGVVAWNARNGVFGKKNTTAVDIVLPASGHPVLNSVQPAGIVKRRAVQAIKDSIQNLDVHPLVAADQQATVDQLIKGIRRGQIDGTVLVSSAREDLKIPDIMIAPITAPTPEETTGEPSGSSRISVPEPSRDSK